MLNILFERKEFFIELLLEHIRISLIAILIAIIIGGISGILISEYERIAKPTLAVVGRSVYDPFYFHVGIFNTLLPGLEMQPQLSL